METQNSVVMSVSKGPDRWRLAESLFHEEDQPMTAPELRFTVDYQGRECALTVHTDLVARVYSGVGNTYRIEGVGNLSYRHEGRSHHFFEHLPVRILFSVHTRKGTASANF